ncbi:hypothetical protein EV646_10310 [Kribbella antiqua]|uniref:Uncharacterized protein n=1 Tax=Kribbella antiqua TaxID=2512217 RepID=A0A4R2ITZ1_9ACTN|nr:hypothetical protein EV646_10310 [Kribbella antiqua]
MSCPRVRGRGVGARVRDQDHRTTRCLGTRGDPGRSLSLRAPRLRLSRHIGRACRRPRIGMCVRWPARQEVAQASSLSRISWRTCVADLLADHRQVRQGMDDLLPVERQLFTWRCCRPGLQRLQGLRATSDAPSQRPKLAELTRHFAGPARDPGEAVCRMLQPRRRQQQPWPPDQVPPRAGGVRLHAPQPVRHSTGARTAVAPAAISGLPQTARGDGRALAAWLGTTAKLRFQQPPLGDEQTAPWRRTPQRSPRHPTSSRGQHGQEQRRLGRAVVDWCRGWSSLESTPLLSDMALTVRCKERGGHRYLDSDFGPKSLGRGPVSSVGRVGSRACRQVWRLRVRTWYRSCGARWTRAR